MLITVKYFASLRERVGKSQETLELSDAATVADVWAKAVPDSMQSTTDDESILAAVTVSYTHLRAHET